MILIPGISNRIRNFRDIQSVFIRLKESIKQVYINNNNNIYPNNTIMPRYWSSNLSKVLYKSVNQNIARYTLNIDRNPDIGGII